MLFKYISRGLKLFWFLPTVSEILTPKDKIEKEKIN